jgi:glycosyltransferase involved in cell wall biosynthesis
MKKSLFILAVLILLTAIGFTVSALRPTKPFTLIYAEDGEITALAQSLTQELNRQAPKTNKKYHLYVANFEDNFIPDIKDNTAVNILYLGSRRGFDLQKLSRFDNIFVSTPDILAYLKDFRIDSTLLVLFPETAAPQGQCAQAPSGQNCYYLVIGTNPDVTSTLADLQLPFRQLPNSYKETLQQAHFSFDDLSAVISNTLLTDPESLDISPLYGKLISSQIPILTSAHQENKLIQPNDTNNLTLMFSDTFAYIRTRSDLQKFLNFPALLRQNAQQAQKLASYLYSPQAAASLIIKRLTAQPLQINLPHSISIISSSVAGLYNIGEYWISKDLEDSFSKLGYTSFTRYPLDLYTNIAETNIYTRGGVPITQSQIASGKLALIYLTFPDIKNVTPTEIESYLKRQDKESSFVDASLVASRKLATYLQSQGKKAYYVPQFTNTTRFYPAPEDDLQTDILFVGIYRPYRTAAPIALKHGFPITIYGQGWPNGVALKDYVDNDELYKYYSSAKIVLNDTREDMTVFDIISNRIFDATACGTLVISDYIPAIEEAYGDTVPMYKTEEELVNLLTYYLDPAHDEERLDKARRAREITLQNFTSDIVARQFDTIIKDLKASQP